MVEEKEITSVPQDNDNSDHMPQEISKPESQLGAGVDVDELIKNGRRNLACEELPQAVEALAEACQILADEHGDQADRLAEPYYYYGKALLELARAENGVLGNALDGVPTEEENEADLSESDQFGRASEVREEERDELRDQIFEAMSAETQSENPTDEGISTAEEKSTEELKSTEDSKPTDESKSTEGDNSPTGRLKSVETENPADAVSADVADPASVEESARGEADPAVGDEMESAGEEEDLETSQDEDTVEDIPNLQLAWEVLELSKRIYSKLSESQPELQRKLADVHMLLGEVGVESENYDQAISDFKLCLQVQQSCLCQHDRLIAETHYQLGTAYSLNGNYKEAVDELRLAKKVLELRLKQLDELIRTSEEKEEITKELEEINQLIPDIVTKIEDASDDAANAATVQQSVKEALSSEATQIGFTDDSGDNADRRPAAIISTKKPNDISNLLKRKGSDELECTTEKKAKPAANSDPAANGDQENSEASPLSAPS